MLYIHLNALAFLYPIVLLFTVKSHDNNPIGLLTTVSSVRSLQGEVQDTSSINIPSHPTLISQTVFMHWNPLTHTHTHITIAYNTIDQNQTTSILKTDFLYQPFLPSILHIFVFSSAFCPNIVSCRQFLSVLPIQRTTRNSESNIQKANMSQVGRSSKHLEAPRPLKSTNQSRLSHSSSVELRTSRFRRQIALVNSSTYQIHQ